MTVYDVYNNGTKIETYGYIHPDDMFGDYFGHIVEYRGSLYEVVTDRNGVLLDPMGTPIEIAPSIQTILEHIEKTKDEMPDVKTSYDYGLNDKHDEADLRIIDGEIYYNGHMIKKIDDN